MNGSAPSYFTAVEIFFSRIHCEGLFKKKRKCFIASQSFQFQRCSVDSHAVTTYSTQAMHVGKRPLKLVAPSRALGSLFLCFKKTVYIAHMKCKHVAQEHTLDLIIIIKTLVQSNAIYFTV